MKSQLQSVDYEEHKKKKVRQKIEEERSDRVKLAHVSEHVRKTIIHFIKGVTYPQIRLQKLPTVNRELAEKLRKQQLDPTKPGKQERAESMLTDDRFAKIFSDPDFQVSLTKHELCYLIHDCIFVATLIDRREIRGVPLIESGSKKEEE